MATTPQALASASNCWLCLGVPFPQAIKLALLAQIVLATTPTADVTPQGLMNSMNCFECNLFASIGDLFEIALLRLLAPA